MFLCKLFFLCIIKNPFRTESLLWGLCCNAVGCKNWRKSACSKQKCFAQWTCWATDKKHDKAKVLKKKKKIWQVLNLADLISASHDLTSMGLLLTTTNTMLLVCVALRTPKSKRVSFTLGGKTNGYQKNMFSCRHFIILSSVCLNMHKR